MDEQGQDPELVPVGDQPVQVGRSSDADLRLLHPTVSRHHATLKRSDQGIDVVDQDSRFGTFVNGVRVRAVCARAGDRIQFGAVTVYRVHETGLQRDVAARGARISAAGLTIARQGSVLVRNAGFTILPDSFVGILGPSGAGKSTLLNCIASYQKAAAGRIIFDEQRDLGEDRDEYRLLLGHVPQEDIVYPALTVRENLSFAARLRLEGQGETAAVHEAVNQALERVGLVEHAAKSAAVLSGGQRKRLSVAIELLKRPRILLLDEPTSGLDPASEANLMEQLRHVASRGTTVVCTTHLMENVRLFDQVIVLGMIDQVGQVGYEGPPAGLLPSFGCRSFADLYEKLSAGRFVPVTAGPQPQAAAVTEYASPLPVLRGLSLVEPVARPASVPTAHRVSLNDLVARVMADSVWRQSQIVASRALLNIARDRGLWLMMLAQPLVLGAMVSLTQFDAASLVPLYFLTVVISIWLGINNSARDLVRDRKHYVRERLSGLRPDAYLAAKVAVYTFIGSVQLALLLAVVRLGSAAVVGELQVRQLRELSSIWFLGVLLACYLCGLGLGLLISALARTEEAAVAAMPLLIIPQLLLSALAAGQVDRLYSQERAFKPLVVMITAPQASAAARKPGGATVATADNQDSPVAKQFVDLVSLLCYSRPGALLLESPAVKDYSRWIWLGDFCHLAILLLGTWTLMYVAFLWAEERWPRLIGLG